MEAARFDSLKNFDLPGAPRFGGLVSMLEGGASVVRVTAGTIAQAGRAISYEEKSLSWSAPTGTSLVVDLSQDLHVIDRIRLKSMTNTSALKELELRVPASGSADSDRTTALVATLPQDGLMHAFTFPPVSARFVQLISRSSYGSTTVTIANFQVFARDVGGGTHSLEDRSRDLDGQLVTYRWELGDGTGSSEPNPTHRYASSRAYRITLVSSVRSNTAAVSNIPPSVASGPGVDRYWGQEELFTGNSVSDPSDATTCEVDWGDGSAAASGCPSNTLSHTYAEPGVYEAVFGAYDGDVTSKDSREVRVHRRPSSLVVLPAEGLTGEDVVVRAQLLDGFEPLRSMGGKLVQLFAKEARLYLMTNAEGIATGAWWESGARAPTREPLSRA